MQKKQKKQTVISNFDFEIMIPDHGYLKSPYYYTIPKKVPKLITCNTVGFVGISTPSMYDTMILEIPSTCLQCWYSVHYPYTTCILVWVRYSIYSWHRPNEDMYHSNCRGCLYHIIIQVPAWCSTAAALRSRGEQGYCFFFLFSFFLYPCWRTVLALLVPLCDVD